MGFFPLGIAFGILAKSMGISAFIAMALSMLGYGGAAQFMMLSLFSVGTSYVEIFIVSYLVNLRHTFYGIWAAGTLLGAILGDFIKADTKGLEFSLTSLFIVVVIEMFKNDKNYRVLFAAVFFGVLGVSLFPAKFVLVGSMALCFVFLLLFKDKI